MGTHTMDDGPCRSYFLEPQSPFHRRYEALRAFFVEGQPPADIAARFGYKPATFDVMVSRFRTQARQGTIPPFSSPMAAAGLRHGRAARATTARMRPRSPISGSST
jgi:hypothetical protein